MNIVFRILFFSFLIGLILAHDDLESELESSCGVNETLSDDCNFCSEICEYDGKFCTLMLCPDGPKHCQCKPGYIYENLDDYTAKPRCVLREDVCGVQMPIKPWGKEDQRIRDIMKKIREKHEAHDPHQGVEVFYEPKNGIFDFFDPKKMFLVKPWLVELQKIQKHLRRLEKNHEIVNPYNANNIKPWLKTLQKIQENVRNYRKNSPEIGNDGQEALQDVRMISESHKSDDPDESDTLKNKKIIKPWLKNTRKIREHLRNRRNRYQEIEKSKKVEQETDEKPLNFILVRGFPVRHTIHRHGRLSKKAKLENKSLMSNSEDSNGV